MEDTVLTVVKRCYFEFKDYILSNIPKKVTVVNACEVINEYLTDEEKNTLSELQQKRLLKKRKVDPLFSLVLVKTKDDEFGFSIKPENFVIMVKKLFEKPFDDLGKIPDLEPKILSDLYKAIKNEAFIKAPIKPTQ